MSALRAAAAAFRFQLAVTRRAPGDVLVLVNTPLLAVVFLTIVEHADRPDLATAAVLAPAVMALWSMAVLVSGDIVDTERQSGTLELLTAAPAAVPAVIAGRIGSVTTISLLGFVEAWLVARLGFGVTVTVEHPGVLAATLVATVAATAGWATAMSAVFVLARSARAFQNALSFPFFILGGALTPVELLPGWLRPVADAVYLSWASDLLRAATSPAAIDDAGRRIAVVALLGAAGFALGHVLLARTVARVRRTGTVSFA